ncbi:MAG: hypothetical protein AAFQ58_23220 [Pseudomonadota bacterium]
MQITASLVGSTATIALRGGNTNTTLTIQDAANLATDLALFVSGDASAVDRSGGDIQGNPNAGAFVHQHWGVGAFPGHPIPPQRSPGYYDDKRQVFPRGYILNPTDDGVQIITPAGTGQNEGKVSIPRDQIGSIIIQLNA